MHTLEEFQAGVTLVFDKPYKWTSFDLVNKVRWNLKNHFNLKKIKVGHAGTLDPLATGVLVICIGKHTKNIPQLTNDGKVYTGSFLLGKTTPCYDLEQDFDAEFPVEHISSADLENARRSFIGLQDQLPPIFSAKQVDGKRAYDLARAGKEVAVKSNEIEIQSFEIDDADFPTIHFRVACSKGTYIRSLAHDFGKKLNSGATLTALKRIQSGDFHLDRAWQIDDWIEKLREIKD